jgi:hypothetical protein
MTPTMTMTGNIRNLLVELERLDDWKFDESGLDHVLIDFSVGFIGLHLDKVKSL